METQNLLEYVASKPGRIDRQRGVLHNVKVLGLESKNNRRYSVEAVRRAVPLYEGVRVHVDHPDNLARTRSYKTQIGSLKSVHVADGLRGDLHINLGHAVASQLLWDAENAPENVGLSHNIEARTHSRAGVTIIEEIVAVRSVDIVPNPATTSGLFEHVDSGSERQQLVEAIAGEIGLPCCCLDGLVGVQHCKDEGEIREHLQRIHNHLVDGGHLPAFPPKLAAADRGHYAVIHGSDPIDVSDAELRGVIANSNGSGQFVSFFHEE